MSPYPYWLRYSWLPCLVLALFSAQYFSWFDFRSLLTAQLPPALLGIALALGICFKSSRVAFPSALLLCVYLAVVNMPWLQWHGLLPLLLALAAVNLALISCSRDRSVISGFGLLLLFAILAQGVGLLLLQTCCEQLAMGRWPAVVLPVPLLEREMQFDPVALLFAAGLLLASIKIVIRPDHAGFALLTGVLLLFIANAIELELAVTFSAIGLLLILLVLRTAYELAFRDELTGIPSRRAYSRYLLTLGRHFSIAVVDIDHFKKLNDRYGHQVGDQALRMVAGKIARFGGGRAFRYGGEEFVVVIAGRAGARAEHALEQMREKIAAYPLRLRAESRAPGSDGRARRRRGQGGGRAIKTTVSVGVASSGGDLKSPAEVLKAADRALYKAKRGGRNRVCVHN
ncbi:GGDEF domain-containing protein [Microbulbifer magnicolonia]|uniref:GGDEF domain-containing protein n=1 Tax=Microbulbifer magnicolonia TaxID=3109744 RepID=UPI002B414EEF|nr:GGDEF domain-containing protein [Microbulbifer sp. GG15]